MKENAYQAGLIKRIYSLVPGCIVMKSDSGMVQGYPDLIIMHGDRYACLEVKRSEFSSHRPNQDYYVSKINEDGGFASFIYPSNEDDVLRSVKLFFDRGK